MDWNMLIGGTIIQMLPLYVVLQIWLPIAWAGRWRLATFAPLVVFIPALAISVLDLTRGSNLWPITMILFAPLGTVYLVALAIVRLIIVRRRRAA